jgi:hypothetical protein
VQYWFRTVLGLLLFFGAATAFCYSIFELLAQDPSDANRLVVAIPVTVEAALAGGALFSGRGKAPWQLDEPVGFAFAIPWWSGFFIAPGVVAIAAGFGAGGGPDGATQQSCFLIGVIFVGMGIAPLVLGLAAPPQRARGGTAATRIAAAAGQGFIALLAISLTLGLMDRIREDDDAASSAESAAEAGLLPPVAPDAPESLFRAAVLREALGALDGDAGVLRLRLDPNALRADLETDSGVRRVLVNRAGALLSDEEIEPVPEESFPLDSIDPAVVERIGRRLAADGGQGLAGVSYLVAIPAAAEGKPGWVVYLRDPDERPRNFPLDTR